MIYGCLTAVNELKIKRFIAYTSINQIGFLIIGITCNSFAGFQSSLIYLLIYIIMNVVFLIIFLNTYNFKIFKELKYFSEFKYLKFTNTTQIFYFTAVIFSMAGIPPFAGFFGKFFLLLEAFNSTLYSVVIVALVTSLISAYYYIRIIKITFFETTFSNTNLINYTNSFYTNVSNFCYNLLFFSPFKNNLIIKKKKMMSNFFMCLIASKNFSTL
jgi:NADH-quinone oxidoreductase subunit N